MRKVCFTLRIAPASRRYSVTKNCSMQLTNNNNDSCGGLRVFPWLEEIIKKIIRHDESPHPRLSNKVVTSEVVRSVIPRVVRSVIPEVVVGNPRRKPGFPTTTSGMTAFERSVRMTALDVFPFSLG